MVSEAAGVADMHSYEAQLSVFLDADDPEILARARRDGVPEAWLEAARHSPVRKMAVEWRIAFPLHPDYRTLPMVWYVPPCRRSSLPPRLRVISSRRGRRARRR